MRRKKENQIFAHNNKYEKNIFKKFGGWFLKLKVWQKVLFVLAILILVLTVAIGGFALSKLSMVDKMNLEKENLSCVDVDGYVNILLLGVDSRNMDDISGAGADAIMVLSLKEETGEVRLISVYRDTYMKFGDTDYYGKVTDANRNGGPEMMIKSLNQAMDLNIHQFVVVNFKMVADLVDSVGGITVNVEDYEIQQLNKYTMQTADNIGVTDYQLVEAPGEQTLEGVQAVSYGRIRKGVGDDFKRTERMRVVISKVFEKLQTMSFKDLNKVLNTLLPQVQTNMNNKDMLIMASKLPTYKIGGSKSWPFDVKTGSLNNISYVFADDLLANTVKLHTDVFKQENYVPSETVVAMNDRINTDLSGINVKVPDEIEKMEKDKEDKDKDKKKDKNKVKDKENVVNKEKPEKEDKPSKPEKPEVKPEKPDVKPDKPDVKPDKPDVKPDKPVEPEVDPDKPDVKPEPENPEPEKPDNQDKPESDSRPHTK